jgi:hypothetical protein
MGLGLAPFVAARFLRERERAVASRSVQINTSTNGWRRFETTARFWDALVNSFTWKRAWLQETLALGCV